MIGVAEVTMTTRAQIEAFVAGRHPSPHELLGWQRASQPLNDAITPTPTAFGAHTAKRVPIVPRTLTTWAPMNVSGRGCLPASKRSSCDRVSVAGNR